MNATAQYQIRGRTSESIASDLEAAIGQQRLSPGDRLPPIRTLATHLGVAPGTVAAAYRRLGERGLVSGWGRKGTTVRATQTSAVRLHVDVPAGVRDLADGSPDPALLPRLDTAVASLDLRSPRYNEVGALSALVDWATAAFEADGVPAGPVAVVGGARDGIERALAAWTRPGDKVALEDPCFTGVLDLVAAMGLEVVPVAVDGRGPRPEALRTALDARVVATVLTPRAQNPTGAALDVERTEKLRELLDAWPDVLLVEDDHAGAVAGAEARTLAGTDRKRWVVVRSVSKALGPDLRVALLTGDETTVRRIEDRQVLGTGWVSTLLQQLVVALLQEPGTGSLLAHAASTYARRQRGAVEALVAAGLDIEAPSGSSLWIPVPEESAVVRGLLDAGWAVGAGERHRIATPPGIRVATVTLDPSGAHRFAGDLAGILRTRPRPSA